MQTIMTKHVAQENTEMLHILSFSPIFYKFVESMDAIYILVVGDTQNRTAYFSELFFMAS